MAILLDGSLTDWTDADRIDGTAPVTGYTVYGKFDANYYLIALGSDPANLTIGPNTTVWLNTDMNSGTGYQVFGWAVGAEYKVEFDVDRVPRLYRVDAAGTST